MTSTPALPDPSLRPAQAPKSRRFKSSRVVFALIMREIASTDSRTSLGFLWVVLEPVGTVLLLTFMFQLLTRTPPLGTSFPLFYITGFLPFQMFTSVASKVSSSVRFSRPLLEFPAVSVLDAIFARFILNFVIIVSVFLILTTATIWIYDLKVIIDPVKAAQAMVLAGMLALAIGTFNSVLFVAFPVYENAYGIVTRPLMLLSGVLLPIQSLPRPYDDWIMWNPVAHPVEMMRGAFYPQFDDSATSPLYLVILSIVFFTLGLVTLRRYFRDALER